MMATVPHVIPGLGLRQFQADGSLLTRVYTCGVILSPLLCCGPRRLALGISLIQLVDRTILTVRSSYSASSKAI